MERSMGPRAQGKWTRALRSEAKQIIAKVSEDELQFNEQLLTSYFRQMTSYPKNLFNF